MAHFEAAIQVVLEHEGGFVSDPRDPGGATKYGISLRWLAGQHLDIDGDGQVDEKDILLLDLPTAKRFYSGWFWRPGGYQRFERQLHATKLLDAAVHLGPFRAHCLAQQAGRLCGYPLQIDGICGPLTVHAANEADARAWLERFCSAQEKVYEMILAQSPARECFRANWLKRAKWPLHTPPATLAKELIA